jgi:hypothetical protein
MWFRKRRKRVIVAHKMRLGIFVPGSLQPGEIGIDAVTGSLFWSTDGYNVYSAAGRIRGGAPYKAERGFYNAEKQDYHQGVIHEDH